MCYGICNDAGIRRSGKSTLLYLLLKDKHYGYINFDDINLYGRDASEIESFKGSLT